LFDLTPTVEQLKYHGYAVCVQVDNPFAPQDAKPRKVEPGTLVRDLDPHGKFPAVCKIDGSWVLRKDWDIAVVPGQIVEFYTYPQGGGNGQGSDVGRTVLMIAAIYVAVQFGQTQFMVNTFGSAAPSIAVFAATTLVNLLVPVQTPDAVNNTSQASNSYTANLSANQARLDQPIPVLYGRNKIFPDYAAEPYSTFDANDDQYFHALFTIGQGEYRFESILIDDTNLTNFSDVLVQRKLAPGVLPTSVAANIVNAPEVTGNELKDGRYVGPFIGCRPLSKAVKISIDIVFSRGLASYDSAGVPGNKTVAWQVEYRAVDDFGTGSLVDTPGAWTILANESITAAQTKPLRRTFDYVLPTACRPQVRLTRATPFDDNSRVANTIEWAGLRCHLQAAAPLCPTATHFEVVMRASEQLSGLSQRKIAVISWRKLRTWSPGGGWSGGLVETRNPAWALADKWTNPVYGDGYEDARCDLQGLYDLSLVWETRQDRFDAVFDQTQDSHAADQMIAQAGRASVFRRNGVMTLSRDALRDLPVTAFTARNIKPGSVTIDYSFANEGTPDGVIVEYWNNRLWDWKDITCPAPGVITPVRPQRMKLFGVTGSLHAEREGLYHAANNYYRRKYPSFATELEGMIPAFGSAVAFAPSLPGWGRGGDLVSFDVGTLTATLTEPLPWTSASAHYVSFIQKDGSLSSPYAVSPGPDEFKAIFEVAPSGVLSTNLATKERTKYVFGAGTPYEVILRVLSIRSQADESGVRTFTIGGVVEDDRVHLADNALLPGEGVIQDDVSNVPDDGSGSGTALVPYLGYPSPSGVYETTNILNFVNNGFAHRYPDSILVGRTLEELQGLRIGGWWLLGAGPYSTAQTGLFDIRVTLVSGDVVLGSAVDTWLALNVTRSWYLTTPTVVGEEYHSSILIEIRRNADGLVLASAVWPLDAVFGGSEGGTSPGN
jgi:hypothetical protein